MTDVHELLKDMQNRISATSYRPWYPNERAEDWEICAELSDNGYYSLIAEGLTETDAVFIAAARTEMQQLITAVNRMLALHTPVSVDGQMFGTFGDAQQCAECEQRWPCNTYEAATAGLNDPPQL